MIDIGTTNFLIKVPSLPKEEFELYSSNLFDQWEKNVEQTLILPDYSISLEVEEGSIKGGGKIAVTLGALYFGIGAYGDFMSGLETIREQASYVGNNLFQTAKTPFGCSNVNGKARKNGGALSRLHTLFENVQRGKLSADEAMIKAIDLFGEEGEKLPKFMNELKEQFETLPRYPEQLSLIDEEWEECENLTNDQPQRKPRPKQPPIEQQFRVEIWRESKNDKKHFKVSKL